MRTAKKVTVRDEDSLLNRLLGLVEQGQEVIIARNDRPMAKLVAISGSNAGQTTESDANASDPEGRWLSEHGPEYAGKWVALKGNRLLASGQDAVKVHQEACQLADLPLIVQIPESEKPPFGGW